MKEYSAARLEYSMLLMPEVISSTERKLPELRELAVQSGIDFAGSTQQRIHLRQEEDTDRLLRMFRRPLAPDVCRTLLEKLLKWEAEALPEAQRLILKTFRDSTVENYVRFMTRCEENCSEWILQNCKGVRKPYARSTPCLVLGFRADADIIPFFVQQAEWFERQFPEQTPLLALYEMRARFQRG